MTVAADRLLRQATLVVAVSVVLASTSGCAGARSFFQMSSDSPVPFFGVDLKLPNKLGQREETPDDDGNSAISRVVDQAEDSVDHLFVGYADTAGDRDAVAESESFGGEHVVAVHVPERPSIF